MHMEVNNTTLIKISGNMRNKNVIISKTIIFKLLLLKIINKDAGHSIKFILIIFPVFHY
jgi:hypothetical protein